MTHEAHETMTKGGVGILGAVIGYADIQDIATVAGIVVSVLMIASLSLDIVRKWRDRNTPTKDLQPDDED